MMAAGLGSFAVWFQWGQTRRCLDFFGPEIARRIQSAPRVELWSLAAGAAVPSVSDRLDVSTAAGVVHLRRGLLEDVNYRWPSADRPAAENPGGRPAPDAWDVALAFFDSDPDAGGASAGQAPDTVLAVDLGDPGSLTVVGRPGRVTLGRMGPGLRKWVEATRQAAGNARKSGF